MKRQTMQARSSAKLLLLLLGTAGVVAAWGSTSKQAACELPCRNQGVCKSGATRHRDLALHNNNNFVSYEDKVEARMDDHHPRFLFEQRPHCLCPAAFTGALCEIEYVMCNSKDDICFNGMPCQRAVDDFGTEFFHCECDAAKSDLSLPGSQKFCEHVSTVFCNAINNGDKGGDPKQRSRGSSFCNNGGRCKDGAGEKEGKLHAGCECPAGYSGPHCEISDHPQQPSGSAYEDLAAVASLANNPRRRVLLSLVVFLSILTFFITAGYTFVVYYGQQQQKKNWKKRGGRSAEERARVPKNYHGRSAPVAQPKKSYAPVNEIEMT